MGSRADEVFEEYNDVPMSKRRAKAAEYAAALRATGELSNEEIETQVDIYTEFDEQAELRSMYGADTDGELNETMESNGFWRD